MQTFEFNKPGENPIPAPAPAPVEEQHEIKGAEPAIQPDPAPVQTSEPDAIEEVKETAPSAPPAPAPAPASAGDKKHHLTYLGNGIWTDAKGKTWCRESRKGCITGMTMTDAELADRPDITFMVRYGAIKDTIV